MPRRRKTETVSVGPLTAAIQRARREAAQPSPCPAQVESQEAVVSAYLSDPVLKQVSTALAVAIRRRGGAALLPPAGWLPPLI